MAVTHGSEETNAALQQAASASPVFVSHLEVHSRHALAVATKRAAHPRVSCLVCLSIDSGGSL